MGQVKTFSVLTVSKRTGWEQQAEHCIAIQTEKPQKWFIVQEGALPQRKTFDEWKERIIPAPPKTRASNLNASLNAGLRLIDTDYVIFYQDFIELRSDCFEKLLGVADERTFVTTCTPNYDGSNDSRYWGLDAPRPCSPNEWEANVAIAPMKMVRELGGFDEEYDNGWSWDNVNLAERAAMLGARFILDESNRPKLYPHEMSSHQTLPSNADRHAATMEAIRLHRKPLRLPYLGVQSGARRNP